MPLTRDGRWIMVGRILCCTLLAGLCLGTSASGQLIPCGNADTTISVELIPSVFYPVKPPGGPGTLRYRDLEFQWDAFYELPGVPRSYDKLTLDRLGITLAELPPHNPFNASLSDIRLTWEYFRADSSQTYDPNPLAQFGLLTGRPQDVQLECSPDTCSPNRAVPLVDR